MNSFVQLKGALTEERPLIKAYEEKSWAALPDSRAAIDCSLDLLDALHSCWADLPRALDWPQSQRESVHPESGPVTLVIWVGSYAWHGRRHLAHIECLIERKDWSRRAN